MWLKLKNKENIHFFVKQCKIIQASITICHAWIQTTATKYVDDNKQNNNICHLANNNNRTIRRQQQTRIVTFPATTTTLYVDNNNCHLSINSNNINIDVCRTPIVSFKDCHESNTQWVILQRERNEEIEKGKEEVWEEREERKGGRKSKKERGRYRERYNKKR